MPKVIPIAPPCPRCSAPDAHWLQFTSNTNNANTFQCSACGHLWVDLPPAPKNHHAGRWSDRWIFLSERRRGYRSRPGANPSSLRGVAVTGASRLCHGKKRNFGQWGRDSQAHNRHAAIGTLLIYADERDRQGTHQTLSELGSSNLRALFDSV
jgi:rubredoxin